MIYSFEHLMAMVSWKAFIQHLAYFSFMLVLSLTLCLIIQKKPIVLDYPNSRSSHTAITPKSGGIAIVINFIVGVLIVFFVSDRVMINVLKFWGFVLSSIAVAVVSLIDDIYDNLLKTKLITQTLCTVFVMSCGVIIKNISLPFVGEVELGLMGYIITFIWIIGLTNAYNFMDGLNGIAAGTGVLVSIFLGIISFNGGAHFVYIICYSIISGTLGFLVFNFPKGKLFMGDVGSAFLGFLFANLSIIASHHDKTHISLLVMPLLLFHFIYDTFFTFMRRLIRRENVFEPHREFLFQYFNQLGYSHAVVTLFLWAVCIAQGFGAIFLTNIRGDKRVLVFVPYFLFQVVYTIIILRKFKRINNRIV